MLLSIRLIFCQFQPGFACKIVAYKESAYVSFSTIVISFQSRGEMLGVIHVCSLGTELSKYCTLATPFLIHEFTEEKISLQLSHNKASRTFRANKYSKFCWKSSVTGILKSDI